MQCTDTPTFTPAQQAAALVLLWKLKDAVEQLSGTHAQRSRARHLRLQTYLLLGPIDDATMDQAKQAYAAH